MMMKPMLAMLHSHHQMNAWVSILLLSTVTIIIFFFYFLFRSPKATANSPPCPPRIPIIGNLHQLGSLPHRSLQALARKYGPIMLLHIGSVPTIIISSAELAREVMKTHDLLFASRPQSSMAKILLYDCDVAFAPYGEYWRRVRKICVINLLSTKMVQSFQAVREEEVSIMVNKIHSSQHNLVNLSELIITLTSNIISRVVLGRRYYDVEGEACKVRNTLRIFLELLGSFPIGDFIPWLAWLDSLSGLNKRARKNFKELDDFLEAVLEEHLQAKSDPSNNHKEDRDFVDILLSMDQKDESTGVSLGRDNIKALILDMFAAGTDTTFTTLEWAMVALIKNPEAMKSIQEEIRGVVGRKQDIKDKDIDKMIYLNAIIKETLRLYPALPLLVPRETAREIELEGFRIPTGTRVMINAWAIGRDSSSWEKPEEFLPERFINSNVDFRGRDFQFIPFGAGRRICPGVEFAIPTIQLTLANLLHRFQWDLPKELEGVLDMTEAPGLTVHKKSGLVLIANPRLD